MQSDMDETVPQHPLSDAVQPNEYRAVSLKQLAAHLGLNPATVSVVLNDVPGRSIPQKTRDRIKAAAKELNYQPSLLARSLRSRRTNTIGILVPTLGDGYYVEVASGVGDHLIENGYFYLTAHHRHQPKLIEEYARMLIGRGAQGIIAIDTMLENSFPIPTVTVAGHRQFEGVTNVILDHMLAAELALEHLYELGHRKIAFMRGQPFSADSDERFQCLMVVAKRLGLEVNPRLIVTLEKDLSSPELGYPVAEQLLASGESFTALVAFNDLYAIGAIRAFEDHNLRVPQDISVLGFDNIRAAAYTLPRLTTIGQPIEEMGRLAAAHVLKRLEFPGESCSEIIVKPTLISRASTGIAKQI